MRGATRGMAPKVRSAQTPIHLSLVGMGAMSVSGGAVGRVDRVRAGRVGTGLVGGLPVGRVGWLTVGWGCRSVAGLGLGRWAGRLSGVRVGLASVGRLLTAGRVCR